MGQKSHQMTGQPLPVCAAGNPKSLQEVLGRRILFALSGVPWVHSQVKCVMNHQTSPLCRRMLCCMALFHGRKFGTGQMERHIKALVPTHVAKCMESGQWTNCRTQMFSLSRNCSTSLPACEQTWPQGNLNHSRKNIFVWTTKCDFLHLCTCSTKCQQRFFVSLVELWVWVGGVHFHLTNFICSKFGCIASDAHVPGVAHGIQCGNVCHIWH